MSFNASSFINHRKDKTSITNGRIKAIIYYIIDCYNDILENQTKYDLSIKRKIKHENFLRNDLVDNYLRKNIKKLNSNTNEYSIFNKEATETYVNVSDNLDHDDPIEIHVVDKSLQTTWSTTSQVYFAIECKRIKVLSDTASYVEDTRKFSERDYKNLRLPFEGQIAFLESSKLSIVDIIDTINIKLNAHNTILTSRYLSPTKIHPAAATFDSSHMRNLDKKTTFSVDHIFLDYSKIVIY